ncbi:MAG: lasso RiPP family leader peptide-containing protein [Actinomycetota bacterium]|nr:lasso RiPP family leader peptide-containing protein [Actinomycetota bacterium]
MTLGTGRAAMIYETPVLRFVGTISELTRGVGGSCADGGGRNNTQRGGGAIGGTSDVNCGPGTGGNPGLP